MIEIICNGQTLDLMPDSAFEMVTENPMLSDTQMPVPYSSSIAFPKTNTNKLVFKYIDALMLEPEIKEINATLLNDGVMLFEGALIYESLEDDSINYSFVGKDISVSLTKKIYDLEHLPAYDTWSKLGHGIFMWAIDSGELKFPIILNKDLTNSSEYPVGSDTCSIIEKYQNYPHSSDYAMFSPAVMVADILSPILELIHIEDLELLAKLKSLAILGLYKTPENFATTNFGFVMDIADTLPDVTVSDFLINVLKLLNASIYHDNQGYRLIANEKIILSDVYFDLTNKVSDSFSSEFAPPTGYTFGYSNEDNSKEFSEAGISSIKDDNKIMVCSYSEFEEHAKRQIEECVYLIEDERDVISARRIRLDGVNQTIAFDLLAHHIPNVENTFEEMYDSSVIFDAIPTVPIRVHSIDNYNRYTSSFACIIPFPSLGSERDSTCMIGYWINNQLVSGDYIFDSNDSFHKTEQSLRPDALFNARHKVFADWLATRRQIISVDLLLPLNLIVDLKIWRKVTIHYRRFLFQRIAITFYPYQKRVDISADLIEC